MDGVQFDPSIVITEKFNIPTGLPQRVADMLARWALGRDDAGYPIDWKPWPEKVEEAMVNLMQSQEWQEKFAAMVASGHIPPSLALEDISRLRHEQDAMLSEIARLKNTVRTAAVPAQELARILAEG